MFWDLYVKAGPASSELARKLGWSGLGLVVPWKAEGEIKQLAEAAKSLKGIDAAVGVELRGPAHAVRKACQAVRKRVELVVVQGGDLEVNRSSLGMPEVDMLASPWKGRSDCGMDHVTAKMAAKNNVAVLFDFHELMTSSRRTRVQVMNNMLEAAKLVRKFRAPFAISSGAMESYDLRAPSDLMSFGRVLGFQDPAIKGAMSGAMVTENRKRLSGKWVMPGVEME
jgi:ribonuclease P/MRP protein subunit RPP1